MLDCVSVRKPVVLVMALCIHRPEVINKAIIEMGSQKSEEQTYQLLGTGNDGSSKRGNHQTKNKRRIDRQCKRDLMGNMGGTELPY